MAKYIKTSLHHIVPQHCENGVRGTNADNNLEIIRHTTHQALHCLFQNQMFAQQLLTMVDINEKALRPDVVKRLLRVLEGRDIDDPADWYKKGTFRY